MTTPVAVHKPAGGPPPGSNSPSPSGGLAGLVKRKPAAAAAVGGVGLVVLIALLRRSGGSQDTAGQPASTLQMTGAGSTYDSTANDLYNSIQPQIDALAKLLQDLQNKQPTPPTTPTPKPPKTTLPAHLPSAPQFPVSHRPTPIGPKSPKPSKPKASYVTIRHGDTLSGIAASHHLSTSQLKKLNPTFWTNPKYHNGNTIYAGGKVRVK